MAVTGFSVHAAVRNGPRSWVLFASERHGVLPGKDYAVPYVFAASTPLMAICGLANAVYVTEMARRAEADVVRRITEHRLVTEVASWN